MRTILITGFGPFPGMPVNPTGPLVRRLGHMRLPALGGWRRITHIFPTSYAAVDRDLPALIKRHRPDALVMFGVAGSRHHISIETLARNTLSRRVPDVTGVKINRSMIAEGGPTTKSLRVPAAKLLATARKTRVPVRLSDDAGGYLCNYLCWRALDVNGPRLAAFIHVPQVSRAVTADDLVRAGAAILTAATAATPRH